MVKRTHGYRYKTRKLLRKKPRERGMLGLSRLLYEYKPGDRVVIDIDPTFISTAPHRRYQGKVGVVVGVRGKAYVVETYLGDKKKIIITTADHLRPYQGGS
mgnify:FL=1|jgi:LSU ribosomal protein L21E